MYSLHWLETAYSARIASLIDRLPSARAGVISPYSAVAFGYKPDNYNGKPLSLGYDQLRKL